ncbi:MAG: hypothetical protein ACOY3Y_20090 [Acidobacteriota bacterium]
MAPGRLERAPLAGCVAAAAVVAMLAAARAVAGPPPAPDGVSLAAVSLPHPFREFRPRVSGRLPVELKRGLEGGWALALDRLEHRPECRGLFHALGADGARTMRASIYYRPASTYLPEGSCRGTAALIRVGSPATVLCPGFGRLNPSAAAAVLIHEALHHAGLEECPPTPGALTSPEITRLVLERCGL